MKTIKSEYMENIWSKLFGIFKSKKHEHKYTIPDVISGHKVMRCEHPGCNVVSPVEERDYAHERLMKEMTDFLGNLRVEKKEKKEMRVYVTLDWAGHPITTKGDGYILPRRAEMIINAKYYPNGVAGEWPVDPDTGEKLPIEPNKYGLK